MVGRRHRRRANIEPTMAQFIVFAGIVEELIQSRENLCMILIKPSTQGHPRVSSEVPKLRSS